MAFLQNMPGYTNSGSVDNSFSHPNQVNMTYTTQNGPNPNSSPSLLTYTNMHLFHALLITHSVTHTYKIHTQVCG